MVTLFRSAQAEGENWKIGVNSAAFAISTGSVVAGSYGGSRDLLKGLGLGLTSVLGLNELINTEVRDTILEKGIKQVSCVIDVATLWDTANQTIPNAAWSVSRTGAQTNLLKTLRSAAKPPAKVSRGTAGAIPSIDFLVEATILEEKSTIARHEISKRKTKLGKVVNGLTDTTGKMIPFFLFQTTRDIALEVEGLLRKAAGKSAEEIANSMRDNLKASLASSLALWKELRDAANNEITVTEPSTGAANLLTNPNAATDQNDQASEYMDALRFMAGVVDPLEAKVKKCLDDI